MSLITGIANANPDLTFRDIASQLEAMHERTPRGLSTWAASSVKHLLDRVKKLGLEYNSRRNPHDPTNWRAAASVRPKVNSRLA
jgi:hypothetical protein